MADENNKDKGNGEIGKGSENTGAEGIRRKGDISEWRSELVDKKFIGIDGRGDFDGFFKNVSHEKYVSLGDAREKAEKGDAEARDFVEKITEAVVGATEDLSEDNPNLYMQMFLGSRHIGKMMDGAFGDLANSISEHYIGKNPQLDTALNRLEMTRDGGVAKRVDPEGQKRTLGQKIDRTIASILGMNVSEEDVPHQDAVLSALNSEKSELSEEVGGMDNGVASSVEVKPISRNSNEKKQRAPGPTARLNETMQESNAVNQRNIEATGKATEAIVEGTKAGIEFVKSQIEGNSLLSGFQKPLDDLASLIKESNTLTAQQIEKMHEQIEWMCLQIDALNKNSESLDQNTLAVMELTTSANLLGVKIDNLTTTINEEQVKRIASQLEDSGISFASLTDGDVKKLSGILSKEVDDSSLVDSSDPLDIARARDLKLELEKARLLRQFDRQIINDRKGRPAGTELNLPSEVMRGERWDGSVEMLYKWLNDIEQGDRSVDDLSTNSGKFGVLYHIKNGEIDKYFTDNPVMLIDENGRPVLESKSGGKPSRAERMTQEQVNQMKYEIDMRLFLHSFYRAASKCATVDDMAKVIIAMHEGDIGSGGDKAIVSFFLNRIKDSGGVGLEKLPTDIAWNMRQEAYFKIEQFTERMKGRGEDFFEALKEMMAEKMKISVGDLDGLGEVNVNGELNWKTMEEAVGNSKVEGDTFSLFKKLAKFDFGEWQLKDIESFRRLRMESDKFNSDEWQGLNDIDFFKHLKVKIADGMGITMNELEGIGKIESDQRRWEALMDKATRAGFDMGIVSFFMEVAEVSPRKWTLNSDSFNELTKLKVEVFAMPQFNFNEPVYQNLDCFEQRGDLKGVLIKEYSVWRMMKSSKGIYSQDNARKAYTLAQRLAVATFMKNKANLIFDQDKYAEKLNLKLERLEDGPGGKPGRRGKSKAVGATETLGFINSLSCHWMDLLKSDFIKRPGENGESIRKPRQFESVYSPLYTNDIDWSKYNYRTTQMYHVLGVLSQAEFVDDAFRNKASFKDVTAPGFLNDLFSKMNKILYEMDRGKIKSLEIKDRPNFYNRFLVLNSDGKINSEIYGEAEYELAELFRYTWVVNILSRIANEKTLGWTKGQLNDFIESLGKRSTIFGRLKTRKGDLEGEGEVAEQIEGDGFVDRELLKRAIKETKVYQAVRRYDQQREDDAKTAKMQQGGMGFGSLGKGK